MATTVVFEVRAGSQTLWAWCTSRGTWGFDEVTFTAVGGQPVDAPDLDAVVWQRPVFTFTVEDEPPAPNPEYEISWLTTLDKRLEAIDLANRIGADIGAEVDSVSIRSRRWPWQGATVVARFRRPSLLLASSTDPPMPEGEPV